MNDEIFSAEEETIKRDLARCIDLQILCHVLFEGYLLTHCTIIGYACVFSVDVAASVSTRKQRQSFENIGHDNTIHGTVNSFCL